MANSTLYSQRPGLRAGAATGALLLVWCRASGHVAKAALLASEVPFNREVIRASESPINVGQEISEQNLLCFTRPLLPRLQGVHTQQEESQSPEERCTVPHSDTFSVSFPSSWRHRRGAPQVYSAHPNQHQIYRAPSGSRSRNRHPQPG